MIPMCNVTCGVDVCNFGRRRGNTTLETLRYPCGSSIHSTSRSGTWDIFMYVRKSHPHPPANRMVALRPFDLTAIIRDRSPFPAPRLFRSKRTNQSGRQYYAMYKCPVYLEKLAVLAPDCPGGYRIRASFVRVPQSLHGVLPEVSSTTNTIPMNVISFGLFLSVHVSQELFWWFFS